VQTRAVSLCQFDERVERGSVRRVSKFALVRAARNGRGARRAPRMATAVAPTTSRTWITHARQ
jgi:hypothetical protein